MKAIKFTNRAIFLVLVLAVASAVGAAAIAALTKGPVPPSPGVEATSAIPVAGKNPKITWSEPKIAVTLSPGENRVKLLTFTSDQAASNITLWVVPELAGFVTVQPSSFASVGANQPKNVTVSFKMPQGAALGTKEGTIHVRSGSKTLPQTLKIGINVWQKFSDPSLGYEIQFPSLLTKTFVQTTQVLALTVSSDDSDLPGIWIYTLNNPSQLSARDWWLQSQDHDPDTEVIENIVLSGLPAIRAKSTTGFNETFVVISIDTTIYKIVRIGLDDALFNQVLSSFKPL